MNWFVYIGGWILVNGVVLSLTKTKEDWCVGDTVKFISVTLIWVWICWKFIR